MRNLANFLRDNMLACPWKAHFHIECPGCGFQRSLAHLLEGNLSQSFDAYPPLLLILLLFFYTGLHLKFKFKKGPKVIVNLFALSCLVIFSNYALKFI